MREPAGAGSRPATFYPRFSGEWYGVMCAAGRPVKLTGNLAKKARRQPQNFSRPGRKRNDKEQS